MLTGNLVSLLSPMLFIPVLSLAFPSPAYDWSSMASIRRDSEPTETPDPECAATQTQVKHDQDEAERRQLGRSANIAGILTIVLTLATIVVWPMPMYGTGYVFSKNFFTGWVVVVFIWLFCSFICVGLYPLWEGRKTCVRTVRAIIKDVNGKGREPSHAVMHGLPVVSSVTSEDNHDGQREKKPSETLPGVEIKE